MFRIFIGFDYLFITLKFLTEHFKNRFLSVSNLIQVNEYFLNRTDRLHTREYDHRKCWIHEYFHEGRPRCLKGQFDFEI